MPRKPHNASRQRTRGNAITINGLLTWRARRLRSLCLKEGDTASVEADLAAIDRVLVNVIGFDGDIDAITRDFRREAIFQRGELQRAVMNVLREANAPLTARQITERVMAAKDRTMRPGRDSKQWITRVRKVCHKLPLAVTMADDGCQAFCGRQPLFRSGEPQVDKRVAPNLLYGSYGGKLNGD